MRDSLLCIFLSHTDIHEDRLGVICAACGRHKDHALALDKANSCSNHANFASEPYAVKCCIKKKK